MTGIHEGNVGARGDLIGADVTYKPDQKTTIKGEYATSERSIAGSMTKAGVEDRSAA